jgi:hypothetical protein
MRGATQGPDVVPARIGPAEFSSLGSMIAVRCPSDLDPWMHNAAIES